MNNRYGLSDNLEFQSDNKSELEAKCEWYLKNGYVLSRFEERPYQRKMYYYAYLKKTTENRISDDFTKLNYDLFGEINGFYRLLLLKLFFCIGILIAILYVIVKII